MKDSNSRVVVPQLAWWGDIDTELTFSKNWDVTVHHMHGHDAPKLRPDEFRKAFANPIGCKPIRVTAQGKTNVVILFDDMSRPTKVAEIVPYVLEELAMAGVNEDHIQFICALGTHGPLTAYDFAKKVVESWDGEKEVEIVLDTLIPVDLR